MQNFSLPAGIDTLSAYSWLKLNRYQLKAMSDVGITMEDYRHVQMFAEYLDMLSSGEKKSYIYPHLAEKYHLGERTVTRKISAFSRLVRV